MIDVQERQKKNLQLMNFLVEHGYMVKPVMSPDKTRIDYLEVGYGEIPDQTAHTKPKEKSY